MADNKEQEDLRNFLNSFRELKKSLVDSEVSIKLEHDPRDWDDFSNQLEKSVADFESQGKDVKKVKKSLSKVISQGKKISNLLKPSLTRELSKVLFGTPSFDSDTHKDRIQRSVDLLLHLEPKLFELAAVSSVRLPSAESSLSRVQAATAILDRLGILDYRTGEIKIPDDLDEGLLEQFFDEVEKLKDSSGSVIKSMRIIQEAQRERNRSGLDVFFDQSSEAAKDISGTLRSVGRITSSGGGLVDAVGSLFNLVQKGAYTIAIRAEKKRLAYAESDKIAEKPALLASNWIVKKINSVKNAINKDFDTLDKSIKNVAAAASSIAFLFEIFYKASSYVNENNKEITELFGVHDLVFGVEADSDQLLTKLSEINKLISGADFKYNTSREERVAAVNAYLRGGGSLKARDLAMVDTGSVTDALAASASVADIKSIIDMGSRYQNLTGISRENLLEATARLNTDSRVPAFYIEALFSEIAMKSKFSGTNSEDSLQAVIQISEEFGSIVGSFATIKPTIAKISQQTGLNEKQAAAVLSGTLQRIKQLGYEDMGHIMALAGIEKGNEKSVESLRADLANRLRTLRRGNQKALEALESNPLSSKQDIANLKQQIAMSYFYENEVARNPDIYASLMDLVKAFPQAALPLFSSAIDGQLKLIYGKNYESVTQTALGFRSALKTISSVFPVPDQLIDAIIAAGYDPKTGRKKQGDLDFSKIESLPPVDVSTREKMELLASEYARMVEGASKLIEGSKAGFISKVASVFSRATNAVTQFVGWIKTNLNKLLGIEVPQYQETPQFTTQDTTGYVPAAEGVKYVPISNKPNLKIYMEEGSTARLTSGFGMRHHPVLHTHRAHEGVDIAIAGKSSAVLSQFGEGEVTYAGAAQGYGTLVRVRLRKPFRGRPVEILYGHMKQIFVKTGDRVSAGAKLGIQGHEGVSAGDHLHLEIRSLDGSGPKGSTAIDPEVFFREYGVDSSQSMPNTARRLAVASRSTTQRVTGAAAWRKDIRAVAMRHGLDPLLLEAVVQKESNGDPHAVSKVGAVGLMQLMPATARELGVLDSRDPLQNLEGGAKYLKKLLRQYRGRVDLALAAYNAGPARVSDRVPNIAETRNYVTRILENRERLARSEFLPVPESPKVLATIPSPTSATLYQRAGEMHYTMPENAPSDLDQKLFYSNVIYDTLYADNAAAVMRHWDSITRSFSTGA